MVQERNHPDGLIGGLPNVKSFLSAGKHIDPAGRIRDVARVVEALGERHPHLRLSSALEIPDLARTQRAVLRTVQAGTRSGQDAPERFADVSFHEGKTLLSGPGLRTFLNAAEHIDPDGLVEEVALVVEALGNSNPHLGLSSILEIPEAADPRHVVLRTTQAPEAAVPVPFADIFFHKEEIYVKGPGLTMGVSIFGAPRDEYEHETNNLAVYAIRDRLNRWVVPAEELPASRLELIPRAFPGRRTLESIFGV